MPAETRNIVDEQGYQFFGCYKCGELISAIELSESLKTTGVGCRCGCMKVQPRQVKAEEYSRRNVIEMAVYLKMSEEEFVKDFLRECEGLDWPIGQRSQALEDIRRHFMELLPS